MRKLRLKYFSLALVVLTLFVTAVMLRPSPPELSAHFYLIYSSSRDIQDDDTRKIEKLFSFGSKQNITGVLTGNLAHINKTTTEFIDEIRNTRKINSRKDCFISLSPPYSDNLKQIRHEIQSQFRGSERLAALRKIIPIFEIEEFNNERTKEMLTNNLLYIEHNFGGIGLFIANYRAGLLESYSQLIFDVFA